MKRHLPSASVLAPRFLALAIGTLLLVLGAQDLGHGFEHAAVSPAVHDEASHPDSASHIDEEEHPGGLTGSTICLKGSLVVDPVASLSPATTGASSPLPGDSEAPPLRRINSGSRPRAPPA